MNVAKLSVVLMAVCLIALALASSSPLVGADSISLVTDQPVHALGESVAITIAYMGGVHGDVKLSVEDSLGAVMNQWAWNHASADAFQQTVSYAPPNAGTYTVNAVHRPHHMEAPTSASVQVGFWSAKIVKFEYNDTADVEKPIDIDATVSYYLTSPAQIKVELWSNSEDRMLGSVTSTRNGQGTEIMTLRNIQFTSVQNQDITARVYYQMPTAEWSHDTTGWSYNGKLTVAPEFAATPALMLLLSLLSLLFIRKRAVRRRVE